MEHELNKRLNDALSQYIRPATFPVAVKLSQDKEFSPRVKRPLRDFGNRITLCQGTALARTYGWSIGFLEEDHACGNSMVIFGLVEEPDIIKNGSIVYPLYTDSLETGSITQKATPALPVKQISSILLSPLHRADFDPDVVLVYGQPGQIARLIQATLYQRGGTLDTKSMGRAACGAEIVTPFLTGECNVVVPGGGEKAFGSLPDDQMVFSIPKNRMEGIIAGLEGTHKAGGSRFPWTLYSLRSMPEFPDIYHDLEVYTKIKER